MCRVPRRKLALNRKTSAQVGELRESSNSQTDQLARDQRYFGIQPQAGWKSRRAK